MEYPVSAFAMYQKHNKKKRKASVEQNVAPVKKAKNTHKPLVLLNKNDKKELNTKKNKIKKIKNKKPIVVAENGNGIASSEDEDEEIPTLVPIDETSSYLNAKTELKPKKSIKKDKIQKQSQNTEDSATDSSEVQVFNPVTQGLAIFKWLIDPTSPREFFEKYWEKEVLHVKRPDRNYFKDVLSSKKLDLILREFPLHFTRNIDVVTYQNGKKEVIEEEGRALPSKLWDYYSNGCSIRVLNPQTYDQNVHSVISSLQEYFGTMVGTNVYLTPPDSQGFAPHFDDIEAFIVQLEGSKYWKLYKPKAHDVLCRDSSPNFNREELPAPFMEVKLNAGDVLYFPRGTIHEGHTKDEHSLHITISVYQHTAYIDLLEHAIPIALQKAAKENIEFRKGLPLNYLKHLGLVNKNDNSGKRKSIIKKVKSLVNSLVDYLDVDSAADQLGRKFMHDAMPPLYSQDEAQLSCKFDGDFMSNGKVFNRVEITSQIKIRLLRYYALRVVKDTDTTSKLYFCTDNSKTYHGEEEQWLEINNDLVPGVEMLQQKYPEFVEADSLPIKDDTEKLGLVSSLWEHGLLVTESPLPCCDSGSDGSSTEDIYELVESDSD